jgi:ADP-dependent NAD(P)H-hydrate dehydratase
MAQRLKTVRAIPRLAPRKREGHKGDYGRVLVIGGSAGMIGAPAMAGLAALRSGAGLVTLAVPRGIQPTAAGLVPCATSIPLRQTAGGSVNEDGANLRDAIEAVDVVAFGPGFGPGTDAMDRRWVRLLRACSVRPVVIDADGLNLLGRVGAKAAGAAKARWVLTPHPGEAARLLGCGVGAVQRDRKQAAVRCQRAYAGEGVVVLKGAGTVVTDGRRVYVNTTGNPGMATGGSGDVLTGVVAALVGQGLDLFDAAVLGVYVHGLAGDLAAGAKGPVSVIATDLIDALPGAFGRARQRRG